MLSKICCRLCCFIIIAFSLAACDDQNLANGQKTSAVTSDDTMPKNKYTHFDTTRSVTRVSPRMYKTLADTLGIRVLQATYKPGDSSIMHAHPDFVLYVLDGGTIELTGEDGNKQKVDFKKDMAVVLPATTHSAKNVGKTTLRVVVMEVDRPRE
jgi:quercetin dioxygenase-like cupin family protein